MKKIIFILILLVNFNNINSQSIQDLDKKAGFKKFKIGDSYSKWKNELDFSKTYMDSFEYLYSGKCCSKIFNRKIEKIKLLFRNDRLVNISIWTEMKFIENTNKRGKSSFDNNIKTYETNFISLFGKPTAGIDVMNDMLIWKGKRVNLVVLFQGQELNYEGIPYTSYRENITISDSKALTEMNENNVKTGF